MRARRGLRFSQYFIFPMLKYRRPVRPVLFAVFLSRPQFAATGARQRHVARALFFLALPIFSFFFCFPFFFNSAPTNPAPVHRIFMLSYFCYRPVKKYAPAYLHSSQLFVDTTGRGAGKKRATMAAGNGSAAGK